MVTASSPTLACPDPTRCTVIDVAKLPKFPTTVLGVATEWWRCYDGRWGYDEFNPGSSSAETRFAPFGNNQGEPVATMYMAQTPEAALLETVFHDVSQGAERLIYEHTLAERLLSRVLAPAAATLLDLRDPVLHALGVHRMQLVTSTAEHYPCTRRVAKALHNSTTDVAGLIWHSRQAELAGRTPSEVVILFGDRYPHERGLWLRRSPGSQNLFEGSGRLLVDELAVELDAVVV